MGELLQRDTSAVARSPRRWRWIRWAILSVLVLGALAALGVLGLLLWRGGSEELDCKTASRTEPDGVALAICQREYAETKRPLSGVYLADLLRRTGNRDEARALANALVGTEVSADALQILGKIAEADERYDEAIRLLQDARRQHRARGQHVEVARDSQALARVLKGQSQYAEALHALDECIAEARAGGDLLIEGYCHLTAANVLMTVGYFDVAEQELDRAEPQLSDDRSRAQLLYERGNYAQEIERIPRYGDHRERAVAAFKKSLEYAQRAQFTSIIPHIHFNLAYSLAELGRTDEADRHLAEAGLLDRDGQFENQRTQLAARIAYRRGNLTLARSLNDRAYGPIEDKGKQIEDEDERIEVCVMQARIAVATNDLVRAAQWAKRGVESAEKVRAEQTATELRPWVLASRREPLELLFTVLARAGRVDDAIGVFDRWQARTLVDEMARRGSEPSPGLASMANRIQRLGQWLPVVSAAPLTKSDPVAVTRTLRQIDLVALAVAEGEVWRITASRGRLAVESLGPLKPFLEQLEPFASAPTDVARASAAGARILPDDVVRKTDDPLYVVLDHPFAGLPVVALRRNGQPLIAVRPVLRAPRIPALGACGPRAELGTSLVIADAAGDLPEARRESSRIASLLGTTALVGDAATSKALFEAKQDALLHVAVHGTFGAGGGVLTLHDRDVSGPEISATKLGPALVVLSACSSALSSDPELVGSISTAFLAAGSERVVATLRRVTDSGALALTSRFYDARGPEDPIRVLARIQAELAETGDKEWPNFAVFGSTVCAGR